MNRNTFRKALVMVEQSRYKYGSTDYTVIGELAMKFCNHSRYDASILLAEIDRYLSKLTSDGCSIHQRINWNPHRLEKYGNNNAEHKRCLTMWLSWNDSSFVSGYSILANLFNDGLIGEA